VVGRMKRSAPNSFADAQSMLGKQDEAVWKSPVISGRVEDFGGHAIEEQACSTTEGLLAC